MTIAPRPRFSVRIGPTSAPEHDGPFEGVPDRLLVPLQHWVAGALEHEDFIDALEEEGLYFDEEAAARAICLQLRIPPRPGSSMYLDALTSTVGDDLLDVVDAVLSLAAEAEVKDLQSFRLLTTLLDRGGSAYRINEAADGLEERVAPAVRDAVRQSIADAAASPSAGSAADHLAAAWQAAYGRGPDPVRSYSESVKAVESAAKAVVEPNNSKATLGSMLSVIRNSRQKFATAIPSPGDPIAPVEAMMRTLWEGQTSRHGSDTPTVPETLEAARAGVHLAAVLIQWFASGAVTRTP
ncbi:hypothetical protein AB0A05_37575 [Streptomyces sp. NPDC046374]|uniref:hypothetical protein n=1 Tax=Streptomyces sp. NPDC046374 TaxID=3154917 RepID=UPI0033D841A9